MSDKLSVEVYNDAKKLIKKAMLIALSLLALAIIYLVADKFYTEHKYSKRSAELIMRAEVAVKEKSPMVFSRTSLGENAKISVWFINDSDGHVLVEKNGDKALFTSRNSAYGGIDTYRQAGNACGGLSFSMKDNFILSVSCDNEEYHTPK
ncbi:TPA: hypothetical protein RU590_003065 [Salmonella enterica]|nr:hypothetical protein [Salmonella enterica]HEA0332613.1 hypothetical protein [Salmonella enterica]HEA0340168.1 hypothetical protein [Salmonella enterica]HEA0821151.1 hypothetical protein [Salmonella enterica]HEA2068146.1 hypothetical protein [Salmonella enterica]